MWLPQSLRSGNSTTPCPWSPPLEALTNSSPACPETSDLCTWPPPLSSSRFGNARNWVSSARCYCAQHLPVAVASHCHFPLLQLSSTSGPCCLAVGDSSIPTCPELPHPPAQLPPVGSSQFGSPAQLGQPCWALLHSAFPSDCCQWQPLTARGFFPTLLSLMSHLLKLPYFPLCVPLSICPTINIFKLHLTRNRSHSLLAWSLRFMHLDYRQSV